MNNNPKKEKIKSKSRLTRRIQKRKKTKIILNKT